MAAVNGSRKNRRSRLPRRFQHDRRDLHRPVVPVFSVAEMYLRNLAFCFTSLSSAPPLSSTWKFLLSPRPQPTSWLPLLSSKRPAGTGHGSTSRQCSSGKLYSLELCCLSILCCCLSKQNHISHWELLGETILCGFIFPISRFLCTG